MAWVQDIPEALTRAKIVAVRNCEKETRTNSPLVQYCAGDPQQPRSSFSTDKVCRRKQSLKLKMQIRYDAVATGI